MEEEDFLDPNGHVRRKLIMLLNSLGIEYDFLSEGALMIKPFGLTVMAVQDWESYPSNHPLEGHNKDLLLLVGDHAIDKFSIVLGYMMGATIRKIENERNDYDE